MKIKNKNNLYNFYKFNKLSLINLYFILQKSYSIYFSNEILYKKKYNILLNFLISNGLFLRHIKSMKFLNKFSHFLNSLNNNFYFVSIIDESLFFKILDYCLNLDDNFLKLFCYEGIYVEPIFLDKQICLSKNMFDISNIFLDILLSYLYLYLYLFNFYIMSIFALITKV